MRRARHRGDGPWALCSPAVPPTAGARGAGAAEHESVQPVDEQEDGDPPECLQGEARAEQDQYEQQNQYQRKHRFHLPGRVYPAPGDPCWTSSPTEPVLRGRGPVPAGFTWARPADALSLVS